MINFAAVKRYKGWRKFDSSSFSRTTTRSFMWRRPRWCVTRGKIMDTKKKEAIMECTSFDELLDAEYGERGTEARENFETEAEAFCLAECLKEQRRLAGLTQEQLAAKIGTKKSYISKIENGHADVQLSTLFRIFSGLGKRISLTVL